LVTSPSFVGVNSLSSNEILAVHGTGETRRGLE
jgi:hypothetical protein